MPAELAIILPVYNEQASVRKVALEWFQEIENWTENFAFLCLNDGYTFTTIPIAWRNCRTGIAKLKIKEMGSRYLFIVLYVWLEKYFSRRDYRKA
jgi:hypothetical protein